MEAGSFLNEQKILWGRDVPYPSQVVALAALFASLGKEGKNAAHREKIARWYWAGVLGEYYGSATETKIARDVPDLHSWLNGGPEPRTLQETLFQMARLRTLRSRGSAAYKGLHALLMRSGCRDFISGKPVEVMTAYSNPLDIHHIFPRSWCDAKGIAPAVYNSIINKTALSAETNRSIGGSKPSEYLARIERRSGLTPAQLDAILATHLIDPASLRADDFHAFFTDRERRLAQLAEEATGKPVIGGPSAEEGVAEMLPVDEEESLEELA